jgi:allantoicase
VSHVRLSVFPDGGVARLRVWGRPSLEPSRGLAVLNARPPDEARAALRRCCGSTRWADLMTASRPFEDLPALLRQGERTWWSLAEADWLEAFAAHPKIGEQRPGSAWSTAEQAGAAGAGRELQDRLAAGNAAYEQQFGFLYIVCATGQSGEELSADLERRLAGTRTGEVRTAAEEQAKILRLRLAKLVEEAA